MPTYRAQVERSVNYDIEFDAVDDDEAAALLDDAAWLDDELGSAQETDVSVQHFGAERISG